MPGQNYSHRRTALSSFSIAGINFVLRYEYVLEPLISSVMGLLDEFLSEPDKYPVTLSVSCNFRGTFPKIKPIPMNLLTTESEWNGLTCMMSELYEITGDSIIVGFHNGCLAYTPHTGEGHLMFFRTRGRNYFTGTLYKLLFIFVSLSMSERGKMMLHGAGLKMKEAGYLFLGASGSGKTTVASLASGMEILSDEATVVGNDEGGFYLHASPFTQQRRSMVNNSPLSSMRVPLNMVIFLHKSTRTYLTPREKASAFAETLKYHVHSFEFMTRDMRKMIFETCRSLFEVVPTYDLCFRRDDTFLSALS